MYQDKEATTMEVITKWALGVAVKEDFLQASNPDKEASRARIGRATKGR